MKRRGRWLLFFLLLAGGIFLLRRTPDQTSHGGRTLDEWLVVLALDDHNRDAIDAVQALGTNAVPRLLEALAAKSSSLPGLAFEVADEVFRRRLGWTNRPLVHRPTVRITGAVNAFFYLGEAGSNAVPGLIAQLDDPERGFRAGICLGYIGAPAVPATLDAAKHGSALARYHLALGLKDLRDARPFVPVLLECVGDTNRVRGESVGGRALAALAGVGTNAAFARPQLSALLTNRDASLRHGATQALERLRPAPGAARGED